MPVIVLSDGAADWTARQDLLASEPDDRDLVVEIDNDGRAHLRFGDGQCGRSPDAGNSFIANYRIGCGVVGNVGAEAISHLVLKNFKFDGVSISVRNPLPAQGGEDPESIAEAKLFAPHDFRDPKKIQREPSPPQITRRLAERNTRTARCIGTSGVDRKLVRSGCFRRSPACRKRRRSAAGKHRVRSTPLPAHGSRSTRTGSGVCADRARR